MTIMKSWKHAWKSYDEIAKIDPWFMCWMYWERVQAWRVINHDLVYEIELAIKKAWFTIFFKSEWKKLYEKIAFWKFKWRTFESIVKKDAKYLWFIHADNERTNNINYTLKHTIEYWMKENWCILFWEEKVDWLTYCKACKTMHNIK